MARSLAVKGVVVPSVSILPHQEIDSEKMHGLQGTTRWRNERRAHKYPVSASQPQELERILKQGNVNSSFYRRDGWSRGVIQVAQFCD